MGGHLVGGSVEVEGADGVVEVGTVNIWSAHQHVIANVDTKLALSSVVVDGCAGGHLEDDLA